MKSIGIIAIIAATSVLAGCGGSSEPDHCEEAANGKLVLLNGIACLGETIGDKPGAPVTGGIDGTGGKPTAATPEYEPNTTLANANLVYIGDGARIYGSVGGGDHSDNFVFTPPASGNYAIYLCGASCDMPLMTDRHSLMVLDQTQSTIAATPIAAISEQSISVAIDAGLAYYVRIAGINGGDYRLVIAPHSAK